MTVRLILPKPHKIQQAFIDSNAKRKVIVSGRRGGKTTGVSILAVQKLLDGRRVLYAAPTQDQTEVFWDNCKAYLDPLIQAKHIYKNETRRLLELGNGRIRAKTAWDADSLRGDWADFLILEEYAMMNPNAWEQVGAPMLLDNDGDAAFISTPKRRNHFHKIYTKAVTDESGRYAYWHFTSLDNPYLSKAALEEITQDMTDEDYRQEILAEFLEGEGQVFRNVHACMKATLVPHPKMHAKHRKVMSVDWGKKNDYTASSVGCVDCRRELAIDRFNKIDYGFQRDRLKVLYNKWQPEIILAESNAMGEPNIDQLRQDGLLVRGFETTGKSKPPLIRNLALALERQEWQFINSPTWTAELEAYEMKVSANTERITYSAPEGMNDDTVIARALMLRAAETPAAKDLIGFA